MWRATALFLFAACTPPSPRAAPSVEGTVDSRTAAEQGLPPCAAKALLGADWREVSGTGVLFCVPESWRPGPPPDSTAAASGEWHADEGEWLEWAIGPFTDTLGTLMPYNQRRDERSVIGGRSVGLTLLILPESYTLIARWDAIGAQPKLIVSGGATSETRLRPVRQAIESVRFPSTSVR